MSRQKLIQWIDIYQRVSPWIQYGFFLFGLLLTLWATMLYDLPPSVMAHGRIHIAHYRTLLYTLVVTAFSIMVYGPALWLEMIFAAPRTMIRFWVWHILIGRLWRLIARLRQTAIRPYLRFQGQRPFQSCHYSLANLFAVTAVPYRLYPLSCTLLE